MRFFLNRPFPGSGRGRSMRVRVRSRLGFEQLDERRLLAADVSEPGEETTAYVAPATLGDTAQPTAESPLWGETTKQVGGTATMNGQNGYGGENGYGGYGFIPPEISQFTNTESTPGLYIFTGRVTDDESVHGLIVHFGGVLEGQTAWVRADGTFELIIQLDPNLVGIATAVVTDWDGIQSQTAECLVA